MSLVVTTECQTITHAHSKSEKDGLELNFTLFLDPLFKTLLISSANFIRPLEMKALQHPNPDKVCDSTGHITCQSNRTAVKIYLAVTILPRKSNTKCYFIPHTLSTYNAPKKASSRSARSFTFSRSLGLAYTAYADIPKSSHTTACVLLLTKELRNSCVTKKKLSSTLSTNTLNF